MRKVLTGALSVCLGFAAVLAVWSLLMPSAPDDAEKLSRMLDSAEHRRYQSATKVDYEQQVNAKVSSILSGIEQGRQVQLALITDAIKNYGAGSEQVTKLCDLKTAQDEQNVKTVSEIIDKHGWLGSERIGAQHNFTLFAVMQDADFTTQEKYTGLMEQAVKQGTLSAEHFARFVDRRALAGHNKQVYGTFYTPELNGTSRKFAPIVDPGHVNERRLAIGLKAIEVFALENNIALPQKGNS